LSPGLRHGVDWDGPSPYDDDNTVEIPVIEDPFNNPDYNLLQQTIDPLANSGSLGIVSTMQFVCNVL